MNQTENAIEIENHHLHAAILKACRAAAREVGPDVMSGLSCLMHNWHRQGGTEPAIR